MRGGSVEVLKGTTRLVPGRSSRCRKPQAIVMIPLPCFSYALLLQMCADNCRSKGYEYFGTAYGSGELSFGPSKPLTR